MLSVSEIIKSAGGKAVMIDREVFDGISTDSRTIKDGEIFLGIKGERFDGNRYFREALKKGGGAIINYNALYSENGLGIADYDFSSTVITVDDTLKALHRIARHIRGGFSGRTFAIVGSNGKTTTKELTASVLAQRFDVLKTPGNLNNHIGMPRSMSYISPNTECLVLEMGTNMPGDVRELCEIAMPDCAVITNIGLEHLEGFGSIGGVREAELEILPYVRTVIANGDDSFLMEGLRGIKGKDIIRYGIDNAGCEVIARDIKAHERGLAFTVCFNNRSIVIDSPLFGHFNVYNSLAAAAAGYSAGLSAEEIKRGLEAFSGVALRFEVLRKGHMLIISDVYNANPSSMKNAIEEFKRIFNEEPKPKRAVAVLGDMLELGRDSIDLHRQIGRMLNDAGFHVFIGSGDMMSHALEEFKGFGLRVSNSDEAAQELLKIVLEGDVILIKGSRGMKMERVTEALKNAI